MSTRSLWSLNKYISIPFKYQVSVIGIGIGLKCGIGIGIGCESGIVPSLVQTYVACKPHVHVGKSVTLFIYPNHKTHILNGSFPRRIFFNVSDELLFISLRGCGVEKKNVTYSRRALWDSCFQKELKL